MSHAPSVRRSLAAVLIFQVLALFIRSYVQLALQRRGLDPYFARDLSYLVVPPILIVFMLPIIRANMNLLRHTLDPTRINLQIVLAAIAIGVIARLVWWLQLFARTLFEQIRNSAGDDIAAPVFSFSCPPPAAMLVALLVFGCLIPFIEEAINRGLIQSWLMPRGRWTAILVSAMIFALFHAPASIPLAFVAGIVFGIQFAMTKTLWSTIITHATYDVLIIFDWRCLNGVWN